MKKTIGIMGGMGPLATVDLMKKVIQLTPAKQDQEHIHLIIDNYPQIPDRTSAILKDGDDPLPYMLESAKRLEAAGADTIAIACNTAHYYYKDIQASITIPIINMPKVTVSYIKDSGYSRVAILATDGTLATNLYQSIFREQGIVVLLPNVVTQKCIMNGIYSIKSGYLSTGKALLYGAAKEMIEQGAEAIIAACTEIPIVLHEDHKLKVIDPSYVLAKNIVDIALGSRIID